MYINDFLFFIIVFKPLSYKQRSRYRNLFSILVILFLKVASLETLLENLFF